MKSGWKIAAIFALAIPAEAALGQMTGVSRPEQVPITTSPEGISQPLVYQPTPAADMPPAVELKVRPIAAASGSEAVMIEAKPVSSAPSPVSFGAPAPPNTSATMTDDSQTVHPGADGAVVMRVGGAANELPAGTLLKIRLSHELTTKATKVGAGFSGELTEAVMRDGRVLLPAGSVLTGDVTDVHGGRRITGAASIHLRPRTVTLPDGTKYQVRGQVADTDLYHSLRVDDEGTILRKDQPLKTLAAVGLATASGAAAGGVFGGWPGALIGAGVGAGVSTVVWLKQDRQTEVPAGTKLVFSLTTPMVVDAQ